jgi:hypothetical protein
MLAASQAGMAAAVAAGAAELIIGMFLAWQSSAGGTSASMWMRGRRVAYLGYAPGGLSHRSSYRSFLRSSSLWC